MRIVNSRYRTRSTLAEPLKQSETERVATMRQSQSQRGVYQWVHMHPNATAQAIRAALKLTEGQTWAAIRVLERAKLLQTIPVDGYGRKIPAPAGKAATPRVNGTSVNRATCEGRTAARGR